MAKNAVKHYTRSAGGNVVVAFLLILVGLFMMLPIVYLIITSLKPLDEIMAFPPRFFVKRPTMENYLLLPKLLSNLTVPFSRYLFNSVMVSLVTTVLHIFVASAAAFVLSKYRNKIVNLLFNIVVFSLLFNGYTLAIPQYFIFAKMGLLNTYLVYILPALPSSLGVFLVKQYMDSSLPNVLIEAARIDGANSFQIYSRIALPSVKPAVMTLLLFSFQGIWSQSSGATVFDEQIKLFPDTLSQIANGGIARTGSTMAASVIMMIPPIVVYLITQSNVMETMSSSGIKG